LMNIKIAVSLVALSWLLAVLIFLPILLDGSITETSKSGFCKWSDIGRAVTIGLPMLVSAIASVIPCVYLYNAIMNNWRNILKCTYADTATKAKLSAVIKHLQASRKQVTNLLLLIVVPVAFGLIYPLLKFVLFVVGGASVSGSPVVVRLLLPCLWGVSLLLRSVLFGLRLHLCGVWKCN